MQDNHNFGRFSRSNNLEKITEQGQASSRRNFAPRKFTCAKNGKCEVLK